MLDSSRYTSPQGAKSGLLHSTRPGLQIEL